MRAATGPALKLLMVILNLTAFGVIAASWAQSGTAEHSIALHAVPSPALPASGPLVAGEGWAAEAEITRIKDQLLVIESEIGEIIDAIMTMRENTGLLAENAEHLEKRLQLVERAVGTVPPLEALSAAEPSGLATQ